MTLKMRKKYKIQIFNDVRGDLCPISFSSLDFVPKRTFIVYNVPKNCSRGAHAHRKTQQCLICLDGEITVQIDDGETVETHTLRQGEALDQFPMEWADLLFNKENSILCVVSSTEYDEKDYIRSYKEFIRELNKSK